MGLAILNGIRFVLSAWSPADGTMGYGNFSRCDLAGGIRTPGAGPWEHLVSGPFLSLFLLPVHHVVSSPLLTPAPAAIMFCLSTLGHVIMDGTL
jgi:hypothetical protein